MTIIYGIAVTGVIFLLIFLAKNRYWTVEGDWVVLIGVGTEHSEIRRLAQTLEADHIRTKIELERKSPSTRLIYNKTIKATLMVKKKDYEKALIYIQKDPKG